MGQKVNPIAFRMGVTTGWRSRWYAGKKNFGDWVVEDNKIREFIRKQFGLAGISRIDIERIGEKIRISLHAARPGLLIGKRGAKVDKMSEDVGGLVGRAVEVDVKELETPELNSKIVCEAIAEQLQKRAPYRRTMRRYAEMVMDLGAKGIKLLCKGRLGGAEIARQERLVLGRIPLNTLRADIDYGTATAILSKGTIGVKCWVYKGEIFQEKQKAPPRPAETPE
ncbi:MAG TPA: 30S ribosomal protein S3 [Planctomycetota bacterium]|nr:30S ribosomal protein S3 [Planctomycetota bacterium]